MILTAEQTSDLLNEIGYLRDRLEKRVLDFVINGENLTYKGLMELDNDLGMLSFDASQISRFVRERMRQGRCSPQ